MVTLNTTCKVTTSGPIFRGGGLLAVYSGAAQRTTLRIAQKVAEVAGEDYAMKRKTDKTSISQSLIFASILFPTHVTISGPTSFTAVVFAGNGVPYAAYVDEGHSGPHGKGKGFAGHHFMKAGMEAGVAAAQGIAQEEFGKIVNLG